MKNKEVAEIFRDIANILEIRGENVFRIRAYTRAAQNIKGLAEDVEIITRGGRLHEIPGIGKELSEYIEQFINTGKMKIHDELKKSLPRGLVDLLNIPSVGPKTVKLLFEKAKIKNISDLEDAIRFNKLSGLPGIKEKTVENIEEGIDLLKRDGIYKDGKFLYERTDEDILKELEMGYVDPGLQLIELKDLKGDLHAHSNWSDGENTIEEMAISAQKLGLSYIAITDHSQSLKVTNGLSVKDLIKKKNEVDEVNKKLKNFRVLYGTEADIDSNGNMDYEDEVLKGFDLVIGAVHTGFKQSKEQLTKRIVKACQNKYVHIISHPTGRLWGARDAYDLDFGQILNVCRDTNTALEINAYPDRLDLNDLNARRAKEAGVKIAINTDSHRADQLTNMRFGIAVARRGWLTKQDVINTSSVEELFKAIKK
ncbi:MAG: PHP domain-containing protein [Candidatus Omnitrophota bacterium]